MHPKIKSLFWVLKTIAILGKVFKEHNNTERGCMMSEGTWCNAT